MWISKRIFLVSTIFFLLFWNNVVNAQDEIFTSIELVVSDEAKAKLNQSKTDIGKGDNLIKSAESKDKALEKYFGSTKKRKQKKGEKKSVDAKQDRIKAVRYYDRAYTSVLEVYNELLSNARFDFPEDKKLADDLIASAASKAENAKKTIASYEKLKSDVLDEKPYSKLKSDLEKCESEYKEAAYNLLDAYKLWKVQGDKKNESELTDKNAWETASNANTIVAYKGYLSKLPKGKYVNEAKKRITELENEEKARSMGDPNDPNKGLVYRVQILADSNKWTEDDIRKKSYKGSEKIEERYADGAYKYTIGFYRKYEDAAQLKKKIKVRGAFVVCFSNGRQIDVTEAQRMEEQLKK